MYILYNTHVSITLLMMTDYFQIERSESIRERTREDLSM